MKLRGFGCWASLTCVLSALVVASGCQIVPEEGDQGPKDGENSRDPYKPGSDPNHPGTGVYQPGPGGTGNNGIPVVRRLALDLRGVAGFAILEDGDDAAASSAPDAPVAPKGLGAGSAASGAAADSRSSVLWLDSNSIGQELRGRAVNAAALRQAIQARSGVTGATPGMNVGWAAQQDPAPAPDGSGETPASPGGAAGAPGSAEGTDSQSGGDTPGGAEGGLLKITQDGTVEPALVALEETPVEVPDATSPDAGAPPVDREGEDPAAPQGTGGATSSGDVGTGGAAPGSGGAVTGAGGAPTGGETQPRYFEQLPRVTAVGLSPDGNVYILFEHSFMYRQPPAEEIANGDAFGPSSPYRCQLFRADGNWQDLTPSAAAVAELECVTNQHEVRTWDTARVMQFDASGKLYFRAVVPGQAKEVFYAYDPATRELSEKVNGNICWRDVQVTPRGSLFYTGMGSGSNGDCSGTSFFRYVSSDNRLTEIARDWWNFKYLAEQDPEDPNNERIIFYGPDPNATGTVGWETACLYRYNPAVEVPADRTQRLVECSSNPMSYIYGGSGSPGQVSDEDLAAFGARCTSEGQLFVGGEGVTGLSQLHDGTLFVVGSFQKKLAGEVHCGLDVNVDHCDSADPAHTTEEACTDAGHEWLRAQPFCVGHPEYQNPGDCQYNNGGDPGVWQNGVGFRHYDAAGASCLTPMAGFSRGYIDCRTPGQSQMGPANLSQQVNGLAYLAPSAGDAPSELRLLSDPAEEVERYWALEGDGGPELYYSVYQSGQYNLMLAKEVDDGLGGVEVERRLILEDFEVYNLQRDPADAQRVLFDALQFSTNEYLFGSADTSLPTPEEIQASVESVQGISGRVETLIILPNL